MVSVESQVSESSETGAVLKTLERARVEKGTLLLIVASVIFVAARLWHLTSYGFFGDEVFTLWTSTQQWHSLFSWVVEDVVHPPLFYALLKIWIDIGGQSLLWIKLLPALLSIISLVPFFLLCRELRINSAASLLALWLMAVNGFLITHAQESRMYSLLLLLVLCSFWLFMKLQNCGRDTGRIHVALGAVNLLLVFTHYFGWVIVALEFVCLLIWRREQMLRFGMVAVVIAMCFSPWAYLVMSAARANPSRATFFWNRPPAWSELVGYYANLNGPLSYRWKVFGTGAVMLVFLSPIVWRCVRVSRPRQPREESRFWFLILFAFVPVALAFVASYVLPQPVWAFRYLIIAAPAYFLALAVAVGRLTSTPIRIVFIMLIAGWAGLSGFTEMLNRDRVAWEPLVNRMMQAESVDEVDLMQTRTTPHSGIPVYVTDPNVGNTIQYYLDKAGETRFHIATVDNLSSPAEERWWAASIRYKHETEPPLQNALEKTGYHISDVIEARAAGHSAVLLRVLKTDSLR
ncbi:MAG TPA: glycosyltransferase family 39 protein [Blastocatellia bacterium]|nr:glycosyltransferase family 39 protein [Blastocatellia bacterium]